MARCRHRPAVRHEADEREVPGAPFHVVAHQRDVTPVEESVVVFFLISDELNDRIHFFCTHFEVTGRFGIPGGCSTGSFVTPRSFSQRARVVTLNLETGGVSDDVLVGDPDSDLL